MVNIVSPCYPSCDWYFSWSLCRGDKYHNSIRVLCEVHKCINAIGIETFSHKLFSSPSRWLEEECWCGWIGRSLFVSKGTMTSNLKLWWFPPEAPLTSTGVPDPQMYHPKRLFLWMPRRMWRIDFRCP